MSKNTKNSTRKNTRRVYKTKGNTHVCFGGLCYVPQDELTEIKRGDKVKVKALNASATKVEVFRPVPKKKGLREEWTLAEPTWRPAEDESAEADEPKDSGADKEQDGGEKPALQELPETRNQKAGQRRDHASRGALAS